MPQVLFFYNRLVDWHSLSTLQIKNIKLHIVTDIKVTINSIFSIFGFRYLVGGQGSYTY